MANNPRVRENLNRGNPGNKGGGRNPSWLKEKCKNIIEKRKLIDFLGDVAAGANVDFRNELDEDGLPTKVSVPADIKDRIKAMEILLERGFGKSEQAIQISGGLEIGLNAEDQEIVKGFLSELGVSR